MNTPFLSAGTPLRVLAAALLPTLLAACASPGGLAPQSSPRDPDGLQAAHSLAGATALSAAAFPAADWWTRLGDPQLDALVAEALRDGPTLAAADARLRIAAAQAGLADAARRPTLSASARQSGVRLPETLAPESVAGDFNTSTVLLLDFSWSPDLWGGRRAEFEAAVGEARAREIDAQAARVTLAANVVRGYVALAEAFDARDVADRESRRADALVRLARQRTEAGLDTRLQLRNAETALGIAQQQAQAAQQRIDALRNALAALLGKGPDRGLDIAPPRLLRAPAPTLPDVLPSELLGHRADVVAARWRVEAAARGVQAAQAAFRPSVNLAALAGLASGGLSDLFGSEAVLGFGGPAISLPIFDGGRLRAGLAQRDAEYDLAVAAYDDTLVAALREVADAVQGRPRARSTPSWRPSTPPWPRPAKRSTWPPRATAPASAPSSTCSPRNAPSSSSSSARPACARSAWPPPPTWTARWAADWNWPPPPTPRPRTSKPPRHDRSDLPLLRQRPHAGPAPSRAAPAGGRRRRRRPRLDRLVPVDRPLAR